jgi:hypothetical protein
MELAKALGLALALWLTWATALVLASAWLSG